MGRPAEREEPVFVFLGAVLCPSCVLDACCTKVGQTISRKIELRAAVSAICEKAGVCFVVLNKCLSEIGTHFIIFLTDRGANHGNGVFAGGAQLLHRCQGVLKHTSPRTFPTSMGRANDISNTVE